MPSQPLPALDHLDQQLVTLVSERLLETQPGFVNWASINNSLDKGEVRAMAWHAIGHGADAVSYWQWRSALNGQEEYHGTIVGADGTPVPLFAEVEQIGKEFAKASPALAGTSVKSEVAILQLL